MRSTNRESLAHYAKRLWQKGWVANHDGNASMRLRSHTLDQRILCTPTGVSKEVVTSKMMVVVDLGGNVIQGSRRPFSEINLHLAYYQRRDAIGAVVHAHPPYATGFGVAGVALDYPFMPEAVVSLGERIPLVPTSLPGADAVMAIEPLIDQHDVLMLSGNGVLSCGCDLEQAYLRLELVEHLCHIAFVARQLGGAQRLPRSIVVPLLRVTDAIGSGQV